VIDLDAEAIYRRFAARVRERVSGRDFRLVGVRTGGVWLAERLKESLQIAHPVGVLDISFYRDDFNRQGLSPTVKPSRIEFDVDGQNLLLDDVLYTGRTVRAAMNELFDYGRPARIDLAVLIDRGGRELPVEASVVGATVEVPREVSIVLSRDDSGKLHLTLEQRSA
jgi:pyrimidine operon attenuation protein/uracil phosphoribosyltransferase